METTIDDAEKVGIKNGVNNTKSATPAKILTADDILDVQDIKVVPVEVPEWGGIVYVKAMTGLQREKYIKSMRQIVGTGQDATVVTVLEHASGKLAALTICDAQGNLLFERSPEMIQRLGQKSAKALERVIDVSAKLNGLDEEKKDKDRAKKDSADETASDSALNID